MRPLAAVLALAATLAAVEEDVLPPGWDASCVYHDACGGAGPDRSVGASLVRDTGALPAEGLIGGGLRLDPATAHPLRLHGPAFARGAPLTVMAWWRVLGPVPEPWSENFIRLDGRGQISFFVRDGRPDNWCALREPTAVFQCYLPGIGGINDPGGNGLAMARPPADWHHIAMVVSRQSVEVFWDARLLQRYGLKGRELDAGDLTAASIGPQMPGNAPLAVDEIIVLSRAVAADELAAYQRAMLALRQRASLR